MPDPSWIVTVAIKSALILSVALILSRLFASHVEFLGRLWLAAFAALVIVLLPLPGAALPIVPLAPTSPVAPMDLPVDAEFLPARTETARLDPSGLPVALVLVLAAAVGVLATLARAVRTWQLVRAAEQSQDERIVGLTYELSERMGLSEPPLVLLSDQVASPCLTGPFNPVLILPAGEVGRLEERELQAVLIHELAHLRSRDNWKLSVYALIAALYAWNPLAWLGLRQARLAMELAADRHAVGMLGDGQGYRRLLASRQVGGERIGLAGFFGGSTGLTRLKVLAAPPAKARWPHLFLPTLLALALPLTAAPKVPKAFDEQVLSPYEVVFLSERDGFPALYRMWIDGTGQRRMADTFNGAVVQSISPCGRWMAYVKGESADRDIFVSNVDGSGERRIVARPGRDDQPMICPEGRRILFMSREESGWKIYIHDLETGQDRFVVDGSEARWHPGGNRILYSSAKTGHQNLWSVETDGRNPVRLTAGSQGDTGATMSADGRYLFYAAHHRWSYNLFRLDLLTGDLRQLTNSPQLDSEGFPNAAGYLFFTTFRTGAPQVARMRLDGEEQVVLTRGPANSWATSRLP
jgi:Tol biopolymer transport system component/beta-lactamase regulating signal transducer with metallopeptidase domain